MRELYSKSTSDVAEDSRARFWRDWIHESMLEMDLVPNARDGFFSSIENCQLTHIAPSKVLGSAQRVCRGAAEIARGGKQAYFLLSQPSTPWLVRHAGQEHYVQPGQSVLVDSRIPYEFVFGAGLDDLTVELSDAWLERWIPCPEQLLGKPLDVFSPWGRALRASKEALLPQFLASFAMPDALIEDHLGALLALASGVEADSPRRNPVLMERCIEAMRARLQRLGLAAADIASQCNVSVRTLHRAFAASGMTFAGTLLRLRVEEAARLLRDPRFKRLTIAEIGRRCGFCDDALFARQFKRVLGVTPRVYKVSQVS